MLIGSLVFIALTIAVLVIVLSSHLHKRDPASPFLHSAGIVNAALSPNGSVIIKGEVWLARSVDGLCIPSKAPITVVGFEDHLLLVSSDLFDL